MNLSTTKDTDLRARKIMGRTHMIARRIDAALQLYTAILRDYPEDTDAALVLADIYTEKGDLTAAQKLRERAQLLDIDLSSEKFDAFTDLQIGLADDPVPTDPFVVNTLLQHLSGRAIPIPESEIDRAAGLLAEILSSSQPGEIVARNLVEIDNLLPALIELNIRQARSDGRPDLARQLQDIQKNVTLNLQAEQALHADIHKLARIQSGSNQQRFNGHVVILSTETPSSSDRVGLIKKAFSQVGCQVELLREYMPSADKRADVVIACNPHTRPNMLESLATCAAFGIPIVLDLDGDFEHIPINHPDYPIKGLSTPTIARAFTSALVLASQIVVTSETSAESLRSSGHSVKVIPDSWSPQNLLWDKPSPQRNTINIGWVGQFAQVDDLVEVRRVITRVLREFTQTQLVIIGTAQAYQLFENIPDSRRLYLPQVDAEDYPYLLGQFDILINPLRNIPFNLSLSQRVLLEAGIKRIPWISSPIPASQNWRSGGLIAKTPDEWHTFLRQLVLDENLRTNLGKVGRVKAEEFTVDIVSGYWLEMIEEVLAGSRLADQHQ